MEVNKEITTKETVPKRSVRKIVRNVFIAILAFILGYIHYRYVSYLFENDRNFSYLSNLEREMSLRTEMGFYYSYYKTVVEERPFIAGISKLMYDRLVEYPKDVNAFNRFNIHPEVVIGALYRYFEPWLNSTRKCDMIDRGEDMSPVESCVGIGEPILFYLEAIWWLAGLTVAAVFLQAMALSESVIGGLLAVTQYFANHAECTRVHWTPNERENFALPLLLLQAWLVGVQLRDKGRQATFQLQVSIFILNCLCLLFWQFSQFIFLTQIAIFFVMEQFRIIDLKTLCIFLHSHFCGLHMAVLLLQGNDMLKSSYFTSTFIAVSIYCLLFSSFRIKPSNRLELISEIILIHLRLALVILGSVLFKQVINDYLEVDEDSHIWDVLYSKISNFKSFHTLLYTCSEVFDFLPMSSLKNLFRSTLIPIVLFNIIMHLKLWTWDAFDEMKIFQKGMADKSKKLERDAQTNHDDTDDSGIENNTTESKVKKRKNDERNDLDVIEKGVNSKTEKQLTIDEDDDLICYIWHVKIDAAIFYNISQMVVYAIMAGLVMRLKLLFATQMCVVSSLMMNMKYNLFPKWIVKYIPLLWIISMLPLLQNLFVNISQEISHLGEFSDIEQERLIEWISRETPANAAFAGSMPVLATVMLTTRRPIVAHPHYEHLEARQRAFAVYKVYGKFSPQELYRELTRLKVTYLIVETQYCYGRSGKGCSFEDIWDAQAPCLADQPQLCHVLLTEMVDHFYPVYNSQRYAVFRVHDYSVRYMPRSFDT